MAMTPRFATLARLGYATRGLVYVLVGALALYSVFAGSSQGIDSHSAIQTLLTQPYGQVWLWAVVVGLVFFVLWRLVQALLNVDDQPHNAKGWLTRAGLLASAVTYAGLALYAAQRALHFAGGDGGGDGPVGWLMSQPFGRYLVGAAGLIVIGVGIAHIVKGFKQGFEDYFDARAIDHPLITPVCTYGLAARGALFVVIGGLMIYAAVVVDPSTGGSLSEALDWLRGLPFGAVLYAAAALGLFAFGAYGLIEARYRRVDGPSLAEVKRAVT